MPDQPVNPAALDGQGLPFTFPPDFDPARYLYGRDGPWPQKPTGVNPAKMAPEVISNPVQGLDQYPYIPNPEIADWATHLENYYRDNLVFNGADAIQYSAQVLGKNPPSFAGEAELAAIILTGMTGYADEPYWKKAFDTVFADQGGAEGVYPALGDDLFAQLIGHGLLSKLLCGLDEADKAIFNNVLPDPVSRAYWKNDASHMRAVLTPNDGEYLAPAITLLSCARPGGGAPEDLDLRVEAIALFGQPQRGKPYNQEAQVFTPADGNAWQLAKYFALQGALVRINLIDHPMVHFPADAINAITKTALPKDNLLLQLLLPHFRLSLPVDNSVLEGAYSLLNRTSFYPYGPYPAKGDEIRKVFPFYWAGSDFFRQSDSFWDGRTMAFPPYSFALQPREIPSRYGAFLNAFYAPILKFTTAVVKCLPDSKSDGTWADIVTWARYVASWIPGFPDENAITDPETLARALASIIWNAAIVHSADHYLMHDLFERKLPLPYVLRSAPPLPSADGPAPTDGAKVEVADVFSARFCDLFFFLPHNTETLYDCSYGFPAGDPRLAAAVRTFKQDLLELGQALNKRYPEFGILVQGANSGEQDHKCFGAGVQY